MNAPGIARGDQVRRALLAVARQAYAQRRLMPTYRAMAALLGCQPAALTKQMRRLEEEGALVMVRTGRRLLVKRVRT